jgi:Uma2 family endonuclease
LKLLHTETMAHSKPHISFIEYIALEKTADSKHEFFNGEVFAMAGGSPEHTFLAMSLGIALGSRLRGHPCRPFGSDLRVRIPATGLATYPDMAVVCGPLQRDPEDADTVTNPTLVAEVLSESTERYDRGVKLRNYFMLASLQEYLLLSQGQSCIEQYSRNPEGSWIFRVLRAGDRLVLPSLGLEIPIDEIYAGVEQARA